MTNVTYFICSGLVCTSEMSHDFSTNTCVNTKCGLSLFWYEGECTPIEFEMPTLQSNDTSLTIILDISNITVKVHEVVEAFKYTIYDTELINHVSKSIEVQCQDFMESVGKCLYFELEMDTVNKLRDVSKYFLMADFGNEIISRWVHMGVKKMLMSNVKRNTVPLCSKGFYKWDKSVTLFGPGNESFFLIHVPDDFDKLQYQNNAGLTYKLSSAYIQYYIEHLEDASNMVRKTRFRWTQLYEDDTRRLSVGVCEHPVMVCEDKQIVISTSNKYTEYIHISEHATVHVDDVLHLGNNSFLVCKSSILFNTDLSIQDKILMYITNIGLSASILSLMLTCAVILSVSPLQTLPGKLTFALALSLATAQLVSIFSGIFASYKIPCKIAAVIQHISWLSAFTWMNSYAVSMSMMFMRVTNFIQSMHLKFSPYVVWSIGLPLLIVTCTVCLDLSGIFYIYGKTIDGLCWIPNSTVLLVSFVTPLSLIILVNMVCFLLSYCWYWRASREAQEMHVDHTWKTDVLVCVKMTCLMGLTWIFGLLANLESLNFLRYIFVVVNSFQGVSIFLAYIGSRNVRNSLKKHFKCVEPGESDSQSHKHTIKTSDAHDSGIDGKSHGSCD